MRFAPLKRFVQASRPLTYGIVQAGPEVPGGVPYIRPVDMTDHDGVKAIDALPRTSREIAAQYSRSAVRAGDLVVSIGPSYGKTMIVPCGLDGANLTQGTARVAPIEECDGRFLRWCLQSRLASSHWDAAVGGATFRALNLGPLAETPISVVPLSAQRSIAELLDGETSRIDSLLTAKRRMIQALSDRQLVAEASAVLPSGDQLTQIPSIPTAPRHWRVLRNKVFMREVNVPSGTGNEELLSVSHITGVTPRSEKSVTMFEAESTVGYKTVQPGDLVINTMWAWMGAAGVARVPGIVSPAYGVYRIDPAVMLPAYFDIVVRTTAYITEMTRYSRGVTSSRLRLYPEEFLALSSPVPPMTEQVQIVESCFAARGRIANLVAHLESQIDLLVEHRQALITAAVTGELEIPGVAV